MKSFCSYFNQSICRSCDLITTDYPAQLKTKEDLLKKALSNLSHPELSPTLASPETHFRNKLKLVVTGTVENPILGLWGEKDLDQGRELLNCPLHLEELNLLLPHVKSFITQSNLPPYNISTRKGEIKGIIAFYSQETSEGYLRLILRSKEALDRIKKNAPTLFSKFSWLKVLSVNIQPVPHAILEGDEEIFITEQKSIKHKLNSIPFSLGPRAFVQTNQKVAFELYSEASSWVKEINAKKFAELFCGQGAFSFFAAPFIQEGLGVEINADAIEEAKKTAHALGYGHLNFKAADAAQVENEVLNFTPDILLVNPPRRGLADAVKIVRDARAKYFIYSSCNYETLARDLKELDDLYTIRKIKIFDMFPQSSHFETLVLLEIKK
jgi:23S rRNA (uracil747-C5)-methyltransferase